MPYSTNPANYPPFFWDLLNSFPAAEPELKFKLKDKKTANAIRTQFYSFIRALETEAEKSKKRGDLVSSSARANSASQARTRKIEIYPDLESDKWVISFNLRDYDEPILEMKKQFEEMHLNPLKEPIDVDTEEPMLENIPEGFGVNDPTSGHSLDGLLIDQKEGDKEE